MDPAECTDEVCLTCSDAASPGVVISLPDALYLPARVRIDGADQEVDVSLVPGVGVGDQVLVHAGTAISLLDQEGPR